MNFPAHAYLLALLSAFAASWASLPLWRAWCLRRGVVDDPGHRKIHAEPTALAGGLAVMTGLVLPLLGALVVIKLNLLGVEAADKLRYGFGKRAGQLTALFVGATGMLALGWLDDRHELRPAPKFLGQLVIASVVAVAGVRVTLFVPNVAFSYAVTVLWILAVTNALNFMDNMNGLCAGLSVVASACFGLLAAQHQQYLVASIAFLTCGAALGFLPHNFPRAKSFLGDSGSHLLGFLLAVLAILPHFHSPKHPQPLAVLSPLLVLAVPLGDLAWVVGRRWRRGQPFYIGDTNHLSHRLVQRGLTRTGAVVLIWLLAAITGGAALLLT
ncbi:MAG: undecaprenyl/decaprenyl-phosphate alpha-N-acetylglucosaminyl 1-phosphate transferase [Verrucomicrobia bacterium]|nr:undecaprenyl/decaprenyl-phosphate alpha-N-acetylglucosaminyl 1-phosphate transferase [Verrucomicrobiota bacterium]